MSDSFLDHLPSQEREKIRKRMRSPEEYERLREKVKGPEDLEREMKINAESAEITLALETSSETQERAKDAVKASVMEQGIEGLSDVQKEAILAGNFDVTAESKNGAPVLSVRLQSAPDAKGAIDAPSGKVNEVFPLKMSLQQQILSGFTIKKQNAA